MDLVLVLAGARALEAAVLDLCESSAAGSLAGNPSVSIGTEDSSDMCIFALLGSVDLVLVLAFALAWEASVLDLCESSSAGSLAGNPVSIGTEDSSGLCIFALLGSVVLALALLCLHPIGADGAGSAANSWTPTPAFVSSSEKLNTCIGTSRTGGVALTDPGSSSGSTFGSMKPVSSLSS